MNSPIDGDAYGTIVRIQRFSTHDGPGIRSTLFLKGCPMRCVFCHNPETWRIEADLCISASKCVGLGRCLKVCPNNVFVVDSSDNKIIQREKCNLCGICVQECWAGAIEIVGRRITANQAVAELLRDQVFFRKSGGGVTISGGEPLFQAEFTRSVLALLSERGIHTAVETCGLARWETLESVAGHCDLIIFGLKHVDPEIHKLWTKVDNSLILDNLRRLSTTEVKVVVHITIVPGFNSDEESLASIGRFLAKLDRSLPVELLPFHKLAEGKYECMGLRFGGAQLVSPTPEMMEKIGERLARLGVNIRH